MTVCKLADLTVAFEHRYPFFPRLMRRYLHEGPADLQIAVTEEEIRAEEAALGGRGRSEEGRLAFREAIALYRKFAEALPAFRAFFLHAAFLRTEGVGIAFSAPSGVGKSTHIDLWSRHLDTPVEVINGDKPLVRQGDDGRFFGYGSPFSGKEGLQINTCAPISHLVFLERGERDSITPLSREDAFPLLYAATLPPRDTAGLALLLPLLSDFLSSVTLWRAAVTPQPSAARHVYHTLFHKENDV